MTKKTAKIVIFIILAGTLSSVIYFFPSKLKKSIHQAEKNSPSVSKQETPKGNGEGEISVVEEQKRAQEEPAPKQPSQDIPEKYLLEMPFYSQAPFSNWDKVHEEMCEEASLLNAGMYLLGKKLSKEETERELMKMKKIEENLFNDYKSTTVSEAKKFAAAYFDGKLKIKIIENPSIEQIEAEISAGNPVVVPLAGRDIGNPNFTPPGPIYHMLAIKGYDSQNFITNDVGTRKGNSYVYKKDVIMKNIHDWNDQDIYLGGKRVLVMYK